MRPSRHCIALLILIVSALGLTRPAPPAARGASPLTPADQAAIRALLPPLTQTYLKASNTDVQDSFGWRLAVDGDTVAIGAFGEDSAATGVGGDQANNAASDAGAVYVFVRTDAGWAQQAYLKASNTDAGDGFGGSLALSGDTLVVGANYEASAATGIDGAEADNGATQAGAAYVFTRSAGVWSQQAYLKASNTDAQDRFGTSVALDGDTLVVGAPAEASNATGVNGDQSDNSLFQAGAAYVFERINGVWRQTAYLKPHAPAAGRTFGQQVAVSGTTIVAGAPWSDGGRGNAYVFERLQGSWTPQATLLSPSAVVSHFGASVAIDGATIAIGAPTSGSPGVGGLVGVFVRMGSAWSQQAVLMPAHADQDDYFGTSVALDGDRVLVGAFGEDSAATGLNGDQQDNSATDAGAAYLFVRSGATWTFETYLKATTTDAGDTLGESVALDGPIIAIGAANEDSAATGINGNQADNSAPYAGAAFSFDGSPPPPTATPASTATSTPTTTPTATRTPTTIPAATATSPAPAPPPLYLPLIPDGGWLVWVVNDAAIPVQPATERGMIYWTVQITLPATLPTTGQYVFSASPDGISPAVVDDGVVVSVGETVIFRYDYGASGPPQPVLVTVPLMTLAPWAGQAITVQFQDLHGSLIGASPVYLVWVP